MNPFEEFQDELTLLINKYSLEGYFGDTPDFILSTFVVAILISFGNRVKERDDWYDDSPKEGE